MKTFTNKQLTSIFESLEKTLYTETDNKSKLEAAFKQFFKIKKKPRDDNEYFSKIVSVTFYSGFKAKTVDDKIADILAVFNDYKKVAKFNETKVLGILKNDKLIRHENKIRSTIFNANQIINIVNEYGSFNNYLKSFGNIDDDKNAFILAKDLIKRFKYLSTITVYHFLTDLGYNFLKPDRVLCRIFYRLGLVESDKDLMGVIYAGRKFAAATQHPIRYIDIAFVVYGQVEKKEAFGLSDGICLEKNPKCELCGMYKFCSYRNKKKIK